MTTTEKAPLLRRIWQRKLTKLLCALIILATAAWVCIPIALTMYLEKWLVANGAESAHIEKIKLNPFAGTVALHGADIRHNGRVVFSDSTIQVDIGLQRLLSKEANVAATLADVVIELEQQEDGGLRIGSYTMHPAPDEETKTTVDEPLQQTAPWYILAREVKLENITVIYRQPDLQIELVVAEGRVERFNTNPEDKVGSIFLKGTVNGTPFDLNLNQVSVVNGLLLDGKVQIAGYQLQDLEQLLSPALAPFKGTAHLNGDARFSLDENGNMAAHYDGTIGYADARLGGTGWRIDGNASWKGGIDYQMSASGLKVVTNGLLALETPAFSLAMETEPMEVAGEHLSFDGKVEYGQTLGGETYKGTVDTSGVLAGRDLTYLLPAVVNLAQQELNFQGTTRVIMDQGTTVNYDGDMALSGSAVDVIDALTVQLGQLGWKGQGNYSLQEKEQVIGTRGALTTNDFALETAAGIGVTNKTSAIQSGVSITLAGQIQLAGTADASLVELQVKRNEAPLVTVAEIALSEAGEKDDGAGIQSVQVKEITVPISETVPVQIEIEESTLEDISSADFSQFAVGRLEVKQSTVMDQQETVLAQLAQIAAQTINATTAADVTVEQLNVEQGQFMVRQEEGATPLATLGALSSGPLSWSGAQGFVTDTITIDSISSGFTREKAPETDEKQQVDKEQEAEKEEVAKGLPVKINTINIVGKSGFTFIDNTLDSPFSTELVLKKAVIEDIDFNDPDHPLRYTIAGAFDTYSPLNIQGSVAPFAQSLKLEQQATLKNYSLQQLSPYVVDAIGTYFQSGELNLNSKLTIDGDSLDIDNTLLLNDIKAQTVDAELAAELNNALPVPLDLALSMLRDNNGNIKLGVPISGELSDLSIGLTDIIVTATGKAIAIGVAPYLAYTFLGPAGALVYLGGQVGQTLLETNLPPLTFTAEQQELTQEQQQVLDKVGPSIQNNEDTIYSICSKVAPAELGESAGSEKDTHALLADEEARKQLFEIGERRSKLVQDYLQESFGIDEERLLICNPGINFEEGGATRIEFRK